jgi:hypothetical protein
MASTITILNTANWCAAFLEQQPLQINGMEPALSSANLVLQTILGPPLSWPWNRKALQINTNTQDTAVAGLTDFAFLEGGSIQTAGQAYEIQVKNLLSQETAQARIMHVSPLLDDGQGNITFRVSPAPAAAIVANLIYQKKAPIIQSLGTTWYPLPDDKNYLAQWGFLSMMSLIGADTRFNEYNSKFITSVLGQQGGLTDLERNIFIGNWTRVLAQLQATQLATAERYRAREV